ncbi:hypothetical protein DP939_25145 [Spongiactinospora rosea]|uniref:Putative Flp pilus-assembly TadG-like N-terminal domain-containing protein n=1 Tax=Spongiactinospora rosea TaxID=2248750 RepID=A0A366LTG0_9ACTN|nr:pilus assembly protein TadG-related protein [Spongiactinospora rosea]RBQ17236.1 hypothetical protein DP939_25145 [Spongiactinospora rosea]
MTLFVIVFALILLLLVGLTADGGAKMTAGRRATAIAEEAARAGAGMVDLGRAYTRGEAAVDPAAAARAARTYLTRTGHAGTVTTVGSRRLRVSVTVREPTVLLSLIGISDFTVTGNAEAELVPGPPP